MHLSLTETVNVSDYEERVHCKWKDGSTYRFGFLSTKKMNKYFIMARTGVWQNINGNLPRGTSLKIGYSGVPNFTNWLRRGSTRYSMHRKIRK